MNHWTPEPWKQVWGYDTHQTKRAPSGNIVGRSVMLPLDDYDRALDCVNGCAGLDPAAYADVVRALGSLVEFAHAALSDTIHDDNLRYFEKKAYAALDRAEHYRYGNRAAEIKQEVP